MSYRGDIAWTDVEERRDNLNSGFLNAIRVCWAVRFGAISVNRYNKMDTKKEDCMGLKEDILKAAQAKGWDPYTQPFKPGDLGLDAGKYGSFSDHCIKGDTQSAQYSPHQILRVAQRNASGGPMRYLLL